MLTRMETKMMMMLLFTKNDGRVQIMTKGCKKNENENTHTHTEIVQKEI